ncbi:MAG TPA: FAD-binding oxidoreductase [Thermoanaerobaculia bacterium]|nr:FAD-binding oxidoreductase [Thermoanaerobaculia bacterium]
METCRIFRPEKRASLAAILASGEEPSYIARGLGRSYGDAALNRGGGVICFERLNRLIAFDPKTGVLECEAGVTFAEILDCFLPRGYFLPVTPGTKFVTLGGAIAHDVHGKNHHRAGTISNFVLDFRLQTPQGDVMTCSPRENPDVFWATVGGAGLTGLLLSARLRLQRVETAYVLVDFLKVPHFADAIDAMAESDHLYEFSVAWIDCLARGKALGRSVLMRANPAKRDDLPARAGDPLSPRRRSERSLPFNFPPGLLNRFTVGAFNGLFYGRHRTTSGRLADIDSFFYPLDSIRDWNRMYGRRGFVQYQLVFPFETGRAGLAEVLESVSASGRGSFLGVLKRFGNANAGLLSFPFPGYTLALDLPASDGLVPFLTGLDAIVLRHGGRLYLAKDAVTTPESFAAMYPRLDEFRAVKARLDPDNRLSSSQARRLGIVPS